MYRIGAWIEMKSGTDYLKAEQLIKKSLFYKSKLKHSPYATAYAKIQLVELYLRMHNAKFAKPLLLELTEQYPLPIEPIHSILYKRLASYYELLNNTDSVVHYLQLNIAALEKYKGHPGILLDSQYKLSHIYEQQGKVTLAFKYLKRADKLSQTIFNSNRSPNKTLFDIKNKYDEQIIKRELRIHQQELQLLKDTNQFLRYKAFIGLLILVVLAAFTAYYLQRKTKKELLTQSLLNQKQKMELEKQSEIVALKNKELLSSALQLLEQDTIQSEIKTSLNKLPFKGDNAIAVQQLTNSLNVNRSQKWKEFEARFTAVNNLFFTSLKAEYPLLTPTDLKMCAFIKLGFMSKDMAQIMGITVEGINTSRSRLRQKIGIERGAVLSEFLQAYTYVDTP